MHFLLRGLPCQAILVLAECNLLPHSALWDKLWKSGRSCPKKFALRKSRGKSDFPEGHSPEGKSDYPRDLQWANFQTIPKAFPQLVRLQASKTEENVSSRMCLNIFRVSHSFFYYFLFISVFQYMQPQVCLTVLNSDFGFWNLESETMDFLSHSSPQLPENFTWKGTLDFSLAPGSAAEPQGPKLIYQTSPIPKE